LALFIRIPFWRLELLSHTENPDVFGDILELVNESELSSIKSVLWGIIDTINDPDSTAKDLIEAIQIDPPLSAKVLKVANSPFFYLQNEVADITRAVILIGTDTVKELALNQTICQIFMEPESVEGYSRSSLWKHSVGVARLAKMILKREFRQTGENLYAAGLLHDMGIIVEDQFFHDKFKQVLTRSKTEKKSLSEGELEVLGYNHAQIGMAVSDDWYLPEELVMTIGYHHDPQGIPESYRRLGLLLHVADYFCQERGLGYGDESFQDQELFRQCLRELGLESSCLDLMFEEVTREIRKMEAQGLL
jgi:putative nucleotidyltransferase with HDIG domain